MDFVFCNLAAEPALDLEARKPSGHLLDEAGLTLQDESGNELKPN